MNFILHNCTRKLCVVCIAIVVVSAQTTDFVFGQTSWQAGTGNWFTASNWTLGVPDANSATTFDAVIENGGTAQLLAPGGSVRRLRVGRVAGPGNLLVDAGSLTVTQNLHLNEGSAGASSMTVRNAGTVNSPSTVIGHTSDFNTSLLISGAGSIVTTNEINVGQAGTGTGAITIEAGGRLNDTDGFIGRFALSTGTATVTGTGSTWANSGILRVGHIGNGTLSVTAGGTVSSAFGYISVGDASTSSVTVSGTGSTWTNSSDLSIGHEGMGTLNIGDGGAVSNRVGQIGTLAGSDGAAIVSGTNALWTNTNGLYVGDAGDASLEISGGADVTDTFAYIGNAASSDGAATVSGSGSTWTNAGPLYVGNAGSGSLTVSNGGKVINTMFGSINIGAKDGSSGTVVVEGVSSSITTNNAFILGGEGGTPTGPGGDAFVWIRSGGQVVSNTGYVGYSPGTVSETVVDGIGSTWTMNQSLFVGNNGLGNLRIVAGGKVNTTSGDANIGGAFGSTGTGSVLVDGAGSALNLSSTGAAGVYVGDDGPGTLTVTNGGTVSVESFNGIQILAQGKVTGNGTLDAWVYNGGVVAPGTSVGTLTITNSPYRQYATGALQIELASASSYDKLNFPDGGAFLEGGTLDVTLLGGYSPAAGTTFDLMDWSLFGSITGTFTTLDLPDLPGMLDWDTSQLYSAGILRVIGNSGLAGDYNNNGTIDTADYVVWRNNNNTGITLPNDSTPGTNDSDYTVWRAHFGQTAASGTVLTNVPEPTSLLLTIAVLLRVSGMRRTSGR